MVVVVDFLVEEVVDIDLVGEVVVEEVLEAEGEEGNGKRDQLHKNAEIRAFSVTFDLQLSLVLYLVPPPYNFDGCLNPIPECLFFRSMI